MGVGSLPALRREESFRSVGASMSSRRPTQYRIATPHADTAALQPVIGNTGLSAVAWAWCSVGVCEVPEIRITRVLFAQLSFLCVAPLFRTLRPHFSLEPASAGVGSSSSRQKSMKCSCAAERSFNSDERHFAMNSLGSKMEFSCAEKFCFQPAQLPPNGEYIQCLREILAM